MEQEPKTGLPPTVFVLGLVSLLMDTSSELVHSLLPVFLASTLGASMTFIGALEGTAEATAQIVKIVSGTLSDRMGRRRPFVLAGYGLSAITKPFFPLADAVGPVVGARLADRLGKGLRGAPRDALIADITEPNHHGRAYGLRQSLDTIGAVAGPLLAVGLMAGLGGNVRLVLWFAVLPAVLSVLTLALFVREPDRLTVPVKARGAVAGIGALGRGVYGAATLAGLAQLARCSEAFLLLRASDLGLPATTVPLVLVGMNIVYAATAYPFGRLSDRIGRRTLLLAGLAALVGAALALAYAQAWPMLALGVALWGLHLGLTQGLLAAEVADSAPAALRGTAFGLFNLVSGLALLLASLGAGILWDQAGAPLTFSVSAAIAATAGLGYGLASLTGRR